MTPKPKTAKTPKPAKSSNAVKDVENSKRLFSVYNKREFLSALMLTNCNPNKELIVMARFRATDEKRELVKEFINEQANVCQKRVEYVMKTNENRHFANLNKCADELSKHTTENRNDNLFSLALERVAQTEELPEPEEVNGIDLKQLYNWMANSMAGYPIEIEDEPTKDFLHECYKELMDDTEILDGKGLRKFLAEQNDDIQQVYSWITNSNYKDYVHRMLGEQDE